MIVKRIRRMLLVIFIVGAAFFSDNNIVLAFLALIFWAYIALLLWSFLSWMFDAMFSHRKERFPQKLDTDSKNLINVDVLTKSSKQNTDELTNSSNQKQNLTATDDHSPVAQITSESFDTSNESGNNSSVSSLQSEHEQAIIRKLRTQRRLAKSKEKHTNGAKYNFKSNDYYFDIAGTNYHELISAVNYSRRNDLFFDVYDGYTTSDIREEFIYDDGPVYETDLSDVIDKITLLPEPDNKYDSKAIKVIVHIDSQQFMVGYIAKKDLDKVWEILNKFKKKLVTIKVNGYMTGGKYKCLDDDNHVRTFNSPAGFNLHIKTTETAFSHTDQGKKIITSLVQNKDKLIIHRMRKPLHSFIAVDIETTDLSPEEGQVIQLAAVKYINDKISDSFNTLVNPGEDNLPLSEFTTNLTGIRSEDAATAPTLDQVKNKFVEFVDNLPWIGHNIYKFDIPFLYAKNIGINEFYAEDTYSLAKKHLSKTNLANLKLPTLKKYYGINEISHNALSDCRTTAQVYIHLRDDYLNNQPSNKVFVEKSNKENE